MSMSETRKGKPIYKRWWAWVGAFFIVGVIASAAGGGKPSSTKLSSAPNVVPTNTSAPSTSTADKTNSTPKPSPKPSPKPHAVIYSGVGDKVLRLGIKDNPFVLAISHVGSSNFAVEQLDAQGQMQDVLVNTIGSYRGSVPINVGDAVGVGALKITADGRWRIAVTPLALVRQWDGSSPITGRGDYVFLLRPGSFSGLDSATITHRGSSNFAVETYADDGSLNDVLVNEIGNYHGDVQIGDTTVLVKITADGTWAVTKD